MNGISPLKLTTLLQGAEMAGRRHYLLTPDEFQVLLKNPPRRTKVVPSADIHQKLGLMGYYGSIEIYDCNQWLEHPLRFKAMADAPYTFKEKR